jgi:hypothetical protein
MNLKILLLLTLALLLTQHKVVCDEDDDSYSTEMIYDSEIYPGKPFRSKSSHYLINKQTQRLLNKSFRDNKLKKHIWEILKVISIYTLVNERKYRKKPRYLRLKTGDLKSRVLFDKINEFVKMPLMKTYFNTYVDNMYNLSESDKQRAKNVNIFDTSKKRKDRLEELEHHLNNSLKRKKDRDTPTAKIEIDRGLNEDNGISIENMLENMNKKRGANKFRTVEEINAPVARFLKQTNQRKKKTNSWKKRSSYRRLKSKHMRRRKKHKPKYKKIIHESHDTRKLTTKLINPVHHHHHRKAFGIPGAPGGGGGVTQGAGVENLKVVINAIGQPSTYLPVEQNDSYKKGYKEADAEPKVIVTRMRLPSRIGN